MRFKAPESRVVQRRFVFVRPRLEFLHQHKTVITCWRSTVLFIMSGSIPLLKKSAHPALSANEEVRIGASGSAGGGTRLESAESLERTFEGPGCGGRTAPLSLALHSERFRRSSVRLSFGLRGDTTGVSLRFSRCHELFIIIYDR